MKNVDPTLRPITYGELQVILTRFKIMLETEEKEFQLDVTEFIKQEDYRRNLFI